MKHDLKEMAAAGHTAILVIECQEGVIGRSVPANLAQLAAAVDESDMLPRLAALLVSARRSNIPVFHCIHEQRPDSRAGSYNTPLTAALRREGARMVRGSEEARILPELAPEEEDFIVSRIHGMTPFHGTELDSLLRNLDIRTVIPTGVSLNVAVPGSVIEAANRGYHVVVPTDCVAGFPADYSEAVIRNSLRALAWLTTAGELMQLWDSA